MIDRGRFRTNKFFKCSTQEGSSQGRLLVTNAFNQRFQTQHSWGGGLANSIQN